MKVVDRSTKSQKQRKNDNKTYNNNEQSSSASFPNYMEILFKRSPELKSPKHNNEIFSQVIASILCSTHVGCITKVSNESTISKQFNWPKEFSLMLMDVLSDSKDIPDIINLFITNARVGWDNIHSSYDAIATSPLGALLINDKTNKTLKNNLLKNMKIDNELCYLSLTASENMTMALSYILGVQLPNELKWIYVMQRDNIGVIIPCPIPASFTFVRFNKIKSNASKPITLTISKPENFKVSTINRFALLDVDDSNHSQNKHSNITLIYDNKLSANSESDVESNIGNASCVESEAVNISENKCIVLEEIYKIKENIENITIPSTVSLTLVAKALTIKQLSDYLEILALSASKITTTQEIIKEASALATDLDVIIQNKITITFAALSNITNNNTELLTTHESLNDAEQ